MPTRSLPARPVQRGLRLGKRTITCALGPFSGTCTFLSINWPNLQFCFKRNFYLDWNFGILFCYLAVWHKVGQNKCKHDKHQTLIRVSFNKISFKAMLWALGQIKMWLSKIGDIFWANPHLMYSAHASNLFLTKNLSAVRLWGWIFNLPM